MLQIWLAGGVFDELPVTAQRSRTPARDANGESFLDVLGNQFGDPGFYVLDEPESALSFTGCLALVRLPHEMAGDGRRRAVVATHSPIIAATPGARRLEVGEWGQTAAP